jgi:UDP-N-acetylmuramoylalanine--D-glutamate ligase
MKGYKGFFKGKKVTVVGLGLLGKGLGDVRFLAECGAEVIVTDLKTKEELRPAVEELKRFKNITFVFGQHRFTDFEDRDFILKGQGVPLDSPFIAHARVKGIPIEMDDSLFIKCAPPSVRFIGITGTRGKTTTTELIFAILKKAGIRAHLGGNIKGVATLALLPKIQPNDTVVLELSSWQLQGFGEIQHSPHIAVFTSFMPDHLNYYKGDMELYFKDKSEIFRYQKKNDVLIVRPGMHKLVRGQTKATIIVAHGTDIPASWQLLIPGEHARENAACAIAVARYLKVPEKTIQAAVTSWKGVPGRLQHIRTLRGIKIYNDTSATTPEATVAGLTALSGVSLNGKVILIAGGTDKGLDPIALALAVREYAKKTILLPGTGTEKLKAFKIQAVAALNLQEALKEAMKGAQKGDSILFSPGFTSFGLFKNEYDRGDQFVREVKRLK